ncbi:glycoside hydrolase family 52 protein [Pedobacter arcticus]|uniref:glycoside hydrolase family 52 protein n=1 Tax=Pedobacter arcticus TaxID=752140 RepID=UPI0002E00AA1|nr:glycoside hydrolase family 52 protein [Pedobacter arcticus]
MNFKKTLFTLVLTGFYLANYAQSFKVDQNLISTPLTDSTDFSLLNSRLGSRFTFSLLNEKQSMQTSSLGFDMDDQTGLLIGLTVDKKLYCFRTTKLPRNASYLKNQQLKFGPTSMEITGETPEGIKVNFTLISSFTPSKDLKDSVAIKTQIFPGFYMQVNVDNSSAANKSCKLQIGLAKTPVKSFNYMALEPTKPENTDQSMLFRDMAHLNAKLALKAIKTPAKGVFTENGFGGLYYEFNLPKKARKEFTQIYATYNDSTVIEDRRINLPLKFYYTQYWKNIAEVVKYAEDNATQNISLTQKFENSLMNNTLNAQEKWVLALSFHTDLANTFFLIDKNKQPSFYVSEGRFKHLSTVDVAHETEVSAVFAPWRLKLQLAQWTHYIARAELTVAANPVQNKPAYQQGMTAAEYGPYLYHDVGDLPFVSETANYDYGPHMAVEENTSFVLLLYWYWKISGDDSFVRSMLGTVDVLMQSVMNRDTNGNGIADKAYGWTTYDANEALKLSPDNTFLGAKQFSAYVVAAEMFRALSNKEKAKTIDATAVGVVDGEGVGYKKAGVAVNNESLREKQANRLESEAKTILATLKAAQSKYGFIPVSLDEAFPKWKQRSVVIGEGLFLPGLAGSKAPLLGELAAVLKKDYATTYAQSITDYGIKLTTDEGTTWFSKTIVADVVADQWYGIKHSSASYVYNWNKNSPYAYNDGLLKKDDVWIGYWYPRGISSLGYWLLRK